MGIICVFEALSCLLLPHLARVDIMLTEAVRFVPGADVTVPNPVDLCDAGHFSRYC